MNFDPTGYDFLTFAKYSTRRDRFSRLDLWNTVDGVGKLSYREATVY